MVVRARRNAAKLWGLGEMTMKAPVMAVLLAAGLAACAPRVPDSNPQGAGFQDYNSYLKSRANQPAAASSK